MQNEQRDTRPNPARVDEAYALPLGSVRIGRLINNGKLYASYGVWVGEYRRYNRFTWPKGRLDTDALLIWVEGLSQDVYEALRVANSPRSGASEL